MLKAIIFDMDGVIIDSEEQHNRAARQVFQAHGVTVDQDYHSRFVGSSTQNLVHTSIQELGLNVTEETLLKEMNQEKKKIHAEEGYPSLPGIIDVIKQLSYEKIKLAIASSSSLNDIKETTKALGIRKYFHCLVSSSQVEHPKPAPDTFELALRELGVNASEALVIEDSHSGILAAIEAGISCVGFYNPNSGQQDLGKADVLLESFEGITPSFFYNVYQRSHGQPVTIASTKRLLIRELSEEDIPELYPIYQDPDVQRFIDDIDDYMDKEIEKHKAYIKNVYSFYGYGLWGIFSKTSGGLIGRCGIENQKIDGKDEIMLSYLLDSNHWGYGYALECCKAVLSYAAQELHIHRVIAVVDKENLRSLNTIKNLDMKPEKELIYKNRDSILFSIQLG